MWCNCTSGPSRRGVTVIELLVVISIIGALAAITLPALSASRESARRTVCQNNLRNVALAVDLHHSSHGRYPVSDFRVPEGVGPDSRSWSFFALLLPHLERRDLYNAIYHAGHLEPVESETVESEEGEEEERNEKFYPRPHARAATLRASGVAHYQLSILLCPSDGSRGPRHDAGDLNGFAVGQTNFKAVMGANWGADESQQLGPGEIGTDWVHATPGGDTQDPATYDGLNHGDGVMFRSDARVRRTKDHVRDGLSNTFLLGEDVPAEDHWCSWPYANNAYSTCAIPPNVRASGSGSYDPSWWPNVQSFRSMHPGGLNFALADGSVRFIEDEIELHVYRGLATIRGGELVSLTE